MGGVIEVFVLYQTPTRFARPAVSAWCGTHGADPGVRYADEDAALTAVCERIRNLSVASGLRSSFDVARRTHGGGIVVRALEVVFVVREVLV